MNILRQGNCLNFEQPEKGVLAAILVDAIYEAVGIVNAHSNYYKTKKRMSEEAKRWLMADEIYCDTERGISFAFICESLSISIRKVRNSLRQENRQDLLLRLKKLTNKNLIC